MAYCTNTEILKDQTQSTSY